MEIPALSLSLSHSKLPKPPQFTITSFNTRASLFASTSVPNISNKTTVQGHVKIKARRLKNLGVVFANSEAQSPPAEVTTDTWLLEPVGDGDTRHIGFKVELPNAFEIASDEVTVGRLPDKADLVIPVATVSAQHARIQKKEDGLLVTDLDSTNGTFIGEKRLRPGVAATAPPGSYITFGDIHLAIFRVSKLDRTVEAPSKPEGYEADQSDDNPTENT